MSEVIGEATLRIGADASSLESGFAKAENSVTKLEKTATSSGQKTSTSFKTVGDAANDASQRIEASGRRLLAQLERESSQIGKTRSEWLAYRAANLGVADAAAPMIERMRAAEQALNKTGVSAAQTANAMRMVPAQMTDIVTQLAGGSSPLLVLTQQGGQLKDMFGGIGPALRGFATYVTGLINPFTVTAAAAGLLGLAIHEGSKETTEFNKSLILTGGFAGKTSEQLSSMAAHISQSIGTQGQAAEVLNKLAGTGKIAGDQIEAIGITAIAMNKATGAAVDETIKSFIALGEEPTKASAKLNEQYHFLTGAVYEQIRALEEQGKKDEAAALAQKALSDALQTRAAEVKANLGFMERAWNGVAGAAKKAWDDMLGIGRPDTLVDVKAKIAAARVELEKMGGAKPGFESSEGGAAIGNGNKQIAGVQARLRALRAQEAAMEGAQTKAAAEGQKKQADADEIEARTRLAAQAKATRSKAAQRKDEIDQLNRDRKLVEMSDAEYNKRVADINEKYKDPKTAKPKAFQDDAATKMLQTLRDQEAATRAALASNDKLTDSERKRAEFLQQIADLKDKKILTADQKSLLANQDAIKAQLDQNVESEKALKLKEEIAKVEERSRQINEQIRNQQASRREGYAREVDAFGLGASAQKQVEAFKSISREYEQMQWQLEKATKPEARNSDAYVKTQADIREGLQQSLKDYANYYDDLKVKQADWKNGFTSAFADYRDNAANVAEQTRSAFSSAFQGMEDAIAKFVTTGKLNFSSLAESIIADIVRMQVKSAASGIMSALAPLIGDALGMSIGGTYGSATQARMDSLVGTVGAANGMNLSGLPPRADGGPVSAGSAYLVGERGPEIFKPNASGAITPNHALGGDINVNVTMIEDSSKAGKVEQQRNGSQVDIKAYVEKIVEQKVAGSIASGGGAISTALERGYGLNRMRGR